MDNDDKQFEQAVQLAAAFVANGDIRIVGTQREQRGMDSLRDLLGTLGQVIDEARVLAVRRAGK